MAVDFWSIKCYHILKTANGSWNSHTHDTALNIQGTSKPSICMYRRGNLAFHAPQIARFCFMFLFCRYVSNVVPKNSCPKLDRGWWSFSAILPDFIGKINRFSLIFSFRVNLEQNIIETKIFVGRFYIWWKKSLFNYLY